MNPKFCKMGNDELRSLRDRTEVFGTYPRPQSLDWEESVDFQLAEHYKMKALLFIFQLLNSNIEEGIHSL